MGDRNKLMLLYVNASEADKNEARRLAWGACGSWEAFDRTLKEVARRGWVNSDGLTPAGQERLKRYDTVTERVNQSREFVSVVKDALKPVDVPMENPRDAS